MAAAFSPAVFSSAAILSAWLACRRLRQCHAGCQAATQQKAHQPSQQPVPAQYPGDSHLRARLPQRKHCFIQPICPITFVGNQSQLVCICRQSRPAAQKYGSAGEHAAPREPAAFVQFSLLYNILFRPPIPSARTLRYSLEMSEELLHTRWSDIPATQLNPLLTRQFVTGSQAMFARIELKKGCIVPRHQHPNEQISYLTQGALRFLIGEEGAMSLKRSSARAISWSFPAMFPTPPRLSKTPINFDIFAPPRQDWITGDDAYLR